MKRIRLSILIPLLLILSSVAGGALLFWEEIRVADRNIQQAGIDNLHASLTHLQNMLNTQLAADNLEDARLSLSVSALHPNIRTLLLADESNSVMLANRYIWEGSRAAQVSGYSDLTAQQIRQTQASSVSHNADLLHGYYPVTLRLVAGGVGVDRVGALFVEYDLAPRFAQARRNAMVQASLVGGLMLAVAIAVALLLHILVSRRVEKIAGAAKRFAAGDLDARVQLRGRDELAELGHAFDDMAGQRKMAQEVLHENEHFLETLFEHIPNMLFVKDAKTLKFLRINTAGEKLLGYSRSELLGKNDYDFFPKEQADFFTSKDREILDGGKMREIPEEAITTRYSGQRLLHTRKIPILADDGAPLYLLGISEDITERKSAEEQLQHSKRGLDEAQRIAHLGNWELDLEHNVLTWSNEIFRIFEIDPEKFGASYDAFLNAIHPEDREMVNKSYTNSLADKTPYDIVHRLLMPDGRIKFVNEKCETHYAEDGRPLRSIGTVHDITERKLDENALHRLNRELRAISNCNETLMRAEDEQALIDDICRIICDDAGYRMAWVGYAENDEAKTIRPAAWAGVEDGYLAQAGICWADTERGRGPTGTAIRCGASSCIQDFSTDPKAVPWRAAASQRGYRSSISMPLKDESANTFGALTIYSSEPNAYTPEEIRLLEELAGDLAFGIMVLRARIERKRAEDGLRLMNERFSLATRAGRLGVWDWNLQKNELVWDDRMYELYGVKREDFVGAHEAWLQGVHPDDRAASDEVSRQAQRGKREYDTEFRVVWPDGSIHYLKAYGQFVRDAEGKPLRMTGVNYDITELKEAENKVKEFNRDLEKRVDERTAQLKAANKELEAFSYTVSHDLRSPLRAIDGFSLILLEDYNDKLDDEGKRLLNVVRGNAIRMGRLIDDILKFSRTGRLEINYSEIDMESLAHAAFEELQLSAAGSRLQLEIEHLPPAMGDSAMMRQVFVNLLSNAIKFSRNREQPKIQVGTTVKDGETIYYVKDNGAGFEMQYADKLFGVFQRLHSVSEFEGTGIGLAIVMRIIAKHGGRVWAEGKINEGAAVYFSLPQAGPRRDNVIQGETIHVQ